MSQWREIDVTCRHCGAWLEACPIFTSPQIDGLGLMDYRHVATHEKECTTRHEAAPYSEWGQYEKWIKTGAKGREA
ncbi:hypothetical protein LCGC14_2346270 [marine sediment metagenome]|uniref:Uncharacterized protein n=1 Tax=marine sediment metagenome TaxID=412755 RepID=A0A0F9F5N3_9ZZZZ